MRRVIFNQKGGVGKSSITCNLAAISASRGLKTLVIDLDVQGNSSSYLGIDIHDEDEFNNELSVTSIFGKKQKRWLEQHNNLQHESFATDWDNLYLLPASMELAHIEKDLESRYKIYKLREALDIIGGDFDRIYIDTPPNFNFYSKSALIATEGVLIPFDCDSFARQSLYNLIDNMMELKEDHNEGLYIEGIVVNQFNPQANLPQAIVDELEEEEMPLLRPFLGSSIKMRESHHEQKPLVYLAPSHKLTGQFTALFDTIEGIDQAEGEDFSGEAESSDQYDTEPAYETTEAVEAV